ncbi:MAG: lamin tail domain-containing protein [Candidatus Saccharimonadales bacterium]
MLAATILPAKNALSLTAPPVPAVPPTLALSEIKITGDEFVILRNNSGKDITDLSSYWLDDFNSNQPLGSGVSRSSQQLPAVGLAKNQTILLSSNGMATCGAAVVSKLSVSLTDSGGFLQVVQTAQSQLGVTQLPIDYVSWSSGADPVIPNVPSATKDPKAAYYRYANATGFAWQLADLDSTNACQLNVAGGTSVNTGLTQATSPVPSVVSTASTLSLSLPTDDIGLAAPQISEVLPNPAIPQTDAEDEFVELYNSNAKAFDLSGFMLQVGTTTVHKYTFPGGTSIEPHQFSAFYSSDTGLSLSNSDGQVRFLDPGGNVLGQTDEYTSAKDNYAWINVNNLWQWTTTPTPNAANILTAPAGTKSSSSTNSGPGKVKGARTTASSSSSPNNAPSGTTSAVQLHPLVLAGVGAAGLLYALYEYRHDLANFFYKLRRNREARRVTG